MSPLRTVAIRETRRALHARWFIAYSAVFLVGGVALSGAGLTVSLVYGFRGFAKGMAGLVHLSLVFVPIMALTPAIGALTDERESGALEYLLAQPIRRRDLFMGKWLGVGAALVLSLFIGFGSAGTVAVLRGVPTGLVMILLLFLILLAGVFLGLGLMLAALVESRARAMTLGVVLWLVLVALGSLGIISAFVRWGLPSQVLVTWSLFNPVEAFRLGIVTLLDPDLSLLGPVGAALVSTIGSAMVPLISGSMLAAWTVVLAVTGNWVFGRMKT